MIIMPLFWRGEASSSASSSRDLDISECRSKRARLMHEDEEDVIQLLDEIETLELVEFDPKVEPLDTWEPPQVIIKFLEKHFNRSLEGKQYRKTFQGTYYS